MAGYNLFVVLKGLFEELPVCCMLTHQGKSVRRGERGPGKRRDPGRVEGTSAAAQRTETPSVGVPRQLAVLALLLQTLPSRGLRTKSPAPEVHRYRVASVPNVLSMQM